MLGMDRDFSTADTVVRRVQVLMAEGFDLIRRDAYDWLFTRNFSHGEDDGYSA